MTKKEKECRTFEIYLTENCINPKKVIWEHERPDFIYILDQNEVACEVTEFDWDYTPQGSTLRKRDKFLNNLHSKLSCELLKKFPLNYEIVIEYISVQIAKSKIDAEIEDIINSVDRPRQALNPSTSVKKITFNKIEGDSTCIYLTFKDGHKNYEETILDIIKCKEKSKSKWPKNYKQNILLISTGWEFSSIILTKKIKTIVIDNLSWDQIFVIDIAERRCVNIGNAT